MGADAWPPGEPILRQILDGTSAGIAVYDTELRYVYVNPALARMHGIPAAEHTGRTTAELLPDLDVRPEVMRAVLADGRPRQTTATGRTPADPESALRAWRGAYHRLRTDDGVVGLVAVVLEVSPFHWQRLDLLHARRRLDLLNTAATRIGTTLDLVTTCRELAEFVVPMVADVAAVELIPDEGFHHRPGMISVRLAAIAARTGLEDRLAHHPAPGEVMDFPEDSPNVKCIRTGRPVVLNRVAEQPPGVPLPAERLRLYRDFGFHSLACLPLFARGDALGTLMILRVGDSPVFREEDIATAQDLAGRAAISLDNARRYTREHGIAVELQRALLSEPGSPHPDLEIAFRYQPAGASALVGGDWYETVRLPFGRTLLAMGDVMGHGVEASVDMSQYRSMLRYVASTDLPPHRILRRLDALIAQSEADRPASCLLALADPARRRCGYANAGHLPPALIGAEGGTLVDLPIGPPLGTGLGEYRMSYGPLVPGQVLLLYTDGLIERRDEDIDVSLRRLTRLRLPAGGDLEDFLDQVFAELVQQPPEDDIAVLAARMRRT